MKERRIAREELTAEQARKEVSYDPETGMFTWLQGRYPGRPAGYDNGDGYRKIRVCGVQYRAHRLAFFLMMGRWPKEEIDHKDCDRGNNRWANLREASTSENAANMRVRSNSMKGAHFNKWTRKFHAQICKNRKRTELGRFDTAEEAHAAYLAAANRIHGEFARGE